MTRVILTVTLLLLQVAAFGQNTADTIKAEQINPTQIIGTYGQDRTFFKIKKNNKCKMTFVAPRSLTYKGTWELRGDTLICAFYHVNVTGGKNKELKNNPQVHKFIVYRGNLYAIDLADGKVVPSAISKQD